MWWKCITLLVIAYLVARSDACQFYPPGEYLRFVRVPENFRVGQEILKLEVHPRNNLVLQPVDKEEDVHYFTYRNLNRTTVSLLLTRSLEDLVDSDNPRNVLKFKVSCDYDDGVDTITSSLSVTVYVEDVNDHAPVFLKAPYQLVVDELTPVGLTIFRGIRATDRDKPNTPNSDVQYAIVAGNERGKFALDSSHQAFLILKKGLDYDSGDREFLLTVTASDRGSPARSTNATIMVRVNDNDDLSPKFTKGVYRTKITEFYPITGERIHKRLDITPPIFAFDQDIAIDAPIRYDIIAGNDRRLFSLDHSNGTLYLEREIDLDTERALPGNTFVLQIQASQINNPSKTGVARVEVEVMDLNDNLPEFEVDLYNISIVENLPNGFSVLQIVALDQDQGDNAEFTYQLQDKSGAFALDSRTGWLTVRDQTILDREKRGSLNMQVYAKEKVKSVTDRQGTSSVDIEVTLLDANDNNPTFIPHNLYDFMITSEAKKGDLVGQIHAIDPDLGRNGQVMYTIQKAPNNSVPFKIEAKSGQIFVTNSPLHVGRHLLFVEASDQPINPSEKRSALAVVAVNVKVPGLKEIAHKGLPDFIGAPYEFWVGSNVGIGTSVGQVRVANVPDKRRLVYDLLHSYHEGVPFAVEERSGTITVIDELDKFNRLDYDFEAVVSNNRDLSLLTNVTIHVVDPKDEKTILLKTGLAPIEFHVKENQANIVIGRLGFKNSSTETMKFSIANQKDVTDHISITSDGTLYTLSALDRESRDTYRLTILADYTKGSKTGTGIYQVTVFVEDENDNSPTFERDFYEGRIMENSPSNSEIDLNYLVHVNDKDTDENGRFSVNIYGDGSEMFRLDKSSGKVYFSSGEDGLDREKTAVFYLKLLAKDKGGMFSEANLTIYVEDENDNNPKFVQFIVLPFKGVEVLDYDPLGNRVGHFERLKNTTGGVYVLTAAYIRAKRAKDKIAPLVSLLEDIVVGASFIRLVAEDRDSRDNAIIKYEMVSETYIPNELSSEPFHLSQYFMVHPTNGEVAVARTLPPESEFRLNISASDKGGLKDHILVRILIKDVNDHSPVFKKSWYHYDAQEASYSKSTLGRIEATDSDFGYNANISYYIEQRGFDIPFSIKSRSGILSVDGLLDRETRDKYNFIVVAKDNPVTGRSLSSSVNVEINVLDINDNAPVFYGYDDLLPSNESNTYLNHHYVQNLPVYYATVAENSPIGTPITKVFANDSDYIGNGNGLLLFDMPYRMNKQTLFAIDSKEGVITTIAKLDYESARTHNVTIVASDLGSPSLSSTALLVITVIDVPEDIKSIEKPVFAHRYYEVEVEENVPVPLKLLTLNVTEPYRHHRLRYSIADDNNYDIKKVFEIDPDNGSLYIIQSPDRESKALYEMIIRLDRYKVGRDMTVMIYPVTNERLGSLGLNEVKVIVRVTDVNDNSPKFTQTGGRPYIAAIPTSANYGFHVIKLQAKDPDLGFNGELRYQILSRSEEETTRRFGIDPVSGQVRATASFTKEAGRVYGFDVKATDRRGADDGRSAIANVFVYILDEHKQLVMVMGMKPSEVESSMDNITEALYNATGFDVRVRKLEPHSERDQVDNSATDMYLYAVDPLLNVVIDMDHLQNVLQEKHLDIEDMLEGPKVLAIASGISSRVPNRSQRILLSSLEVGIIVLGCIVFVGALSTAICVLCFRRRKKRLTTTFTKPFTYPFSSPALGGLMGKTSLFPAAFPEGLNYGEGPMSGVHHHHDSTCQLSTSRRITPGTRDRTRSTGCVDKSIASLHSSGHDSGIVDALQCQCGRESGGSGDDSSDYEDSLKSIPPHHGHPLRRHSSTTLSTSRGGGGGADECSMRRNTQRRRSRNRSIGEDIVRPAGHLHRVRSSGHLPQAMLLPGPSHLRRSTERLMMASGMIGP